jgi:hypothetical protein
MVNAIEKMDLPLNVYAIEYVDGDKEWYLDDIKLSEEKFLQRRKDKCDGKVVEIDGKKYELKLVAE